MGATYVTIQGNLTEDPFYKRYSEETELARFRLASSKRVRTKDTDLNGQPIWADTDHLYIDVKCWGQLANNCCVSLRKGFPVTVTGKLITESWEEPGFDKHGNAQTVTRSKIVLNASQVAFNLSHFQVNSMKNSSVANTIEGTEPVVLRDAGDIVSGQTDGQVLDRDLDTDDYAAAEFEAQRVSAEDQVVGERVSAEQPF